MKKEEKKAKDRDKKKKEKPLPSCTTAPSAEHARGDAEDDPCDDYRSGK